MSSGAGASYKEKQLVRLQVLGELHGQPRRHAFMHVMQQMHFRPLLARRFDGCLRAHRVHA